MSSIHRVAAPRYRIETYVDAAGEHRWRVRAANGEIVIPPEGYKNKDDMKRTIAGLRGNLHRASVVEVDE